MFNIIEKAAFSDARNSERSGKIRWHGLESGKRCGVHETKIV